MANKIILIGPINKGSVPCTGDTVKNQLFLKRFAEVFEEVIVVDTYHWQRRPWCLLTMIYRILLYRKTKIVISANSGSAYQIVRLLNLLNVSKRAYYWVVGGALHSLLESGEMSWKVYTNLAGIFVQGKKMVQRMRELGLQNVQFVPNSKYIDYIPLKNRKTDTKTHFVFLSRIEKYKGCDEIFEAISLLNKKGYKGRYDITFYGKTTDQIDYRNSFTKSIAENEDTTIYRGVLDLRNTSNYDELATYDVMLFPTFWPGEGFPGVVIDAYIAGLPVIASDWNFNSDVIINNQTGWIVPTHNVILLAEKMEYAIDHMDVVSEYSINSQMLAKQYDSRIVLSEDILKKLGLIDK